MSAHLSFCLHTCALLTLSHSALESRNSLCRAVFQDVIVVAFTAGVADDLKTLNTRCNNMAAGMQESE